jgi:hypothetical protein
VPEYCTCGAELPPDARFCHKCGKPQRDEPLLVEEQPAPPPPPPPPAAPLPIGFRNPLAFRVGFLSALVALLLILLLAPGFPVWLAASGFLGAYLYRGRSGEALSTRSGARMGWLTGLLTFLVSSLPVAWAYVNELTDPKSGVLLRQQMSSAFHDPAQRQMLAFLQTPLGIASQILALLVLLFVTMTLLSLLGGVVAAKVLGRK